MKLLQTFTRTNAMNGTYTATLSQKDDGTYYVECSNVRDAFARGFVNFNHALDYALDWIRP